ncbi:hypothetical protein [Pseudostreptobacillus hongkongensis]|uniref:hypothetical protein n=1 Tax=Pseudostreptobacillus hongkongensis TaxID=1162717 RepID=UPI00082F91C1|nr:hypothetical protein [Pseudostreptobacillus hongkongensis]
MRKYLTALLLPLTFSCYVIETPMSKYTAKEVSAIASKKVMEVENEEITYSDTRIMKKGYGKWYLTLYGKKNLFKFEIDENGNILKYEKLDYNN